MHIFLARHGETRWSRSGQHTGTTDLPLTEEGKRQAEALARRLAGETFDLVLSSPAARAVATAEAAGFPFEVDEDLRELDYGEYEGLTTVQVRGRVPYWDLWGDGCPGGETVAEVGARCDAVLQRLVEAAVTRVLLFGHSHTFRILTARYLGLDAAMGRLFKLDTATLSELGEYHARPVVLRWNSAEHLST